MEKIFVKDLEANQVVVSSFMITYKELRQKKDGDYFLSLTLSDRTGDLLAIMWDNFQDIVDSLEVNDFVNVKGSVSIYNNRLQIILHRIKKLTEEEVDPADYLPSSQQDPEAMFHRLEEVVSSVKNSYLRRLLEQIFSDSEIVRKFKLAPAAKGLHHVYLGGLLEHTLSVIDLCQMVCQHYQDLNRDLLIAGAVLHDLGKIDELSYSRSFNYTDQGRLLGHILMECQTVEKEIDKIEGFPAELRLQLLHLLASHHGTYEFGSPRRPKTLEALVLHYLDDMDAKVESMQQSISGHPTLQGNWSHFNKILERYIYRKKVDEDD